MTLFHPKLYLFSVVCKKPRTSVPEEGGKDFPRDPEILGRRKICFVFQGSNVALGHC